MKLLPALVIANTLQWSFGKLRRIEQRPARQIQEYNADSSPSSSGNGESSTAHLDSDVGVLSIKEHQENALRHLQVTDSCDPSNIVDCVDGYVNGSDPPEKCKYACGNVESNTGGECCNGNDACTGFTGQVCKNAENPPCSGTSACKNANIVSVYKSCIGTSSCEDAGSNNAPYGTSSGEGYVGELIDSCVGSASCFGIGSDGGFIGKIISSCNNTQACAGAAGFLYLPYQPYQGAGGTIVGIYDSCYDQQSCKLLGSKGGFVGKVTNSCASGSTFASLNCYKAAYGGGAIQEIYDSCMTEKSCYGLTNAAQTETRQRMLAKKSKPANPNKPPAPAPKPANPNKPEPNTPNPNKPTPPPAPPVETPAPGPTPPPVPDGALCLVNCCNAEVFYICGGSNTQADLETNGGCPAECSGSITPWGA